MIAKKLKDKKQRREQSQKIKQDAVFQMSQSYDDRSKKYESAKHWENDGRACVCVRERERNREGESKKKSERVCV